VRAFIAALTAAVFLLPFPAYAATRAVVITARAIALFADRGLLIADGGVSVRSSALQIDATRAVYDLRANRLVASGDVSLNDGGTRTSATGYVYEFAHGTGRIAPGASVPQLPSIDALAIAQQVELSPGVSLTFSNAQVRAGSAFVPSASYTYDIPPPAAKDFGYSPVPSAALEWPVMISSGRNAYAFARMRYDRYNGGPGTGVEAHYAASGRGYLALAQTLDVDGGRLDFAAYQRMNDALSQSFTGSLLAGARALRYAVTSSTRRGFTSLSFAQFNGQRSDDLLVSGNERSLGRIGSSRLQIVAGHDVHPGDWPVRQDFRMTPSVHFDTATIALARATFSASFDLGETLYDYGRATLSSGAAVWSTVPVNRRLQFNGGMNFSHEAPPFPSTYRTYTAGVAWHAGDAFNLVSSLTYAHDFAQSFGAGRPQFSAALDVRIRRKSGRGVEIGTILPFGGVGNMNRQAVFNVRFLR